MLASSSSTRDAISHFSEQVFTNSRYFCRLSKKRKLRCGSSLAAPDATGGTAVGLTTGRTPGGVGSNRTRRRAGAPSRFRAMNERMRSSVSVVMRPPLRRRLASLPSLTARRPKVDSASPRVRQNSLISWRICSFMAALPRRLSEAVIPRRNQFGLLPSTKNVEMGKVGKVGGICPINGKYALLDLERSLRSDVNGFDQIVGDCPHHDSRLWAVLGELPVGTHARQQPLPVEFQMSKKTVSFSPWTRMSKR